MNTYSLRHLSSMWNLICILLSCLVSYSNCKQKNKTKSKWVYKINLHEEKSTSNWSQILPIFLNSSTTILRVLASSSSIFRWMTCANTKFPCKTVLIFRNYCNYSDCHRGNKQLSSSSNPKMFWFWNVFIPISKISPQLFRQDFLFDISY